jgi:hypothetical protein
MKVIASWFECSKCEKPCMPVHLREQSFSECHGADLTVVRDTEIDDSRLPMWVARKAVIAPARA